MRDIGRLRRLQGGSRIWPPPPGGLILLAMTDSRRPVPSKQTRPPISLPPPTVQPPDEQWIDLREAEQLTGIPASTVRNWARKHRIDSRFEMDESGDRRYVNLTEVIAWADHLGRQHKRVESRESRVASGESRVAIESDGLANGETLTARDQKPTWADTAASDSDEPSGTRDEELATRDASETRDEQPATRDSGIPEGTMLVPLDAWNKMLNQLGNLHEAGQQLAEARERAAKAETEVVFLRERLTELRTRTEPAAPEPATAEPPAAQEEEIEPLWVDLYRRWKRRRI